MKIHSKIVICGNYGASNLGDEAILEGILTIMRQVVPQAEITVLSAKPEETTQLHAVKSAPLLPCGVRSLWHGLKKGTIAQTARAVREADCFILGGGGLFTDEKPMAVFIWGLQAFFALMMGKPLVCLGQSVGPLKTPLARYLTAKVFKRARKIIVRDQSSAEVLATLGVENVQVLADPAFGLSFGVTAAARREKYVVWTVRPWKGDSKQQYKVIAAMVDWLWAKKGLKSMLVPFQIWKDNDMEPLAAIQGLVKNQEAVAVYEYTVDLKEVFALFGNAYAVLGMRLHSLIFACMTQTPFLALSYSQKVNSFVAALELEKYVLRWDDFSFEELQKSFENLEENYDVIQNRLMEKNMQFRYLAAQYNEVIREMLDELRRP